MREDIPLRGETGPPVTRSGIFSSVHANSRVSCTAAWSHEHTLHSRADNSQTKTVVLDENASSPKKRQRANEVHNPPVFAMLAGLEDSATPAATALELDTALWKSDSNPIDASSFLPSPKCPPRAWHRIPVPAVSTSRKIWKRTVATPGAELDAIRYALSQVELESQGQGTRKRARRAGYVPTWGEAQWHVRSQEPRNVSRDLAEARAAIAELQDESETERRDLFQERSPTYPEEKLRWVPRKRHNSRWPIEPTTRTKTTMMAALRPLLEFEVPTACTKAAAVKDDPESVTEKDRRQRSTRRLSRRASLAHFEDASSHHSSIRRRASLAAPILLRPSPVKKVSASPKKSFTLLASPTKVIFRPSPSKSPLPTQTPPTPSSDVAVEVPEAAESPLLSESSFLVFEQPAPDVQTEPVYEAHRRESLRNRLRLDRSHNQGRRSLDFGKHRRVASSRRHSCVSQQTGKWSTDNKSRRHTLDALNEDLIMASEMDHDEDVTTGFSSAETTENISEVVVDVCANLDIFGTKSGITRRRNKRRESTKQNDVDIRDADNADAVPSSASTTQHSSQAVDDSPLPVGLGITHEAGQLIDSPGQADMLDTSFSSASHSDNEADMSNTDFWLDDGIGSTPEERSDTRLPEVEGAFQDDMFAPHDPEGLSTIFEDDEASFAPSSSPPRMSEGTGIKPGHDIEEDTEKENTVHADKMGQSSDWLETEAHLEDPSAEADAVPSLGEQHEGPTDESATASSPLFDRSFQDEELVLTGTVVLDALSVLESSGGSMSVLPNNKQGDEDTCPAALPSPLADRSYQDEEVVLEDILVVDDFSVLESAAVAHTPSVKEKGQDAFGQATAGIVDAKQSPSSHVEVPSSPAAVVVAFAGPASTPPQSASAAPDSNDDTAHGADMVRDTPPHKGFVPINSDRVSPPFSSSPIVKDDDEDDQDDQDDVDDLQEEDMALAMDYEPTVPINMDEDEVITVQASKSEQEAEPSALEEDSDTEMLRQFVTRVSANKTAKAAAAAAALARRTLRPKRRSGSTGSTTSSTGSPASKSTTASSTEAVSTKTSSTSVISDSLIPRPPLGEKDANSPSPTKKRKTRHQSDNDGKMHPSELFRGNEALFSAEISPPKSKRLRSRKRAEAEPATNTSTDATSQQSSAQLDSSQQQDMDTESSAPRRSTRGRKGGRVQLKPAGPSANSIAALSLIPVRPSAGFVLNAADTSGDRDMPIPVVVSRASRITAAEKDLAAMTRFNTRKNKAGAVPPKVVLSRQAEDALGFKLKELKGVFDAKEAAVALAEQEDGDGEDAESDDGRKSRRGKGVRWASELVRYNTDLIDEEDPKPPVTLPLAPSRKGAKVVVPVQPTEERSTGVVVGTRNEASKAQTERSASLSPPDEVQETVLPMEAEPQQPKPAPAPTRRTRQSRLQPPTPVSKKILADSSSGSMPPAPSSSVAGVAMKMATRRTKIASLGMGVNGTPAPKRRTRA